jgi:hypothetical protein
VISTETITELRRLLSEATPGPWTAEGYDYCPEDDDVQPWGINEAFVVDNCGDYPSLSKENAQLIVAAINALPALLNERDSLQRELALLREVVRSIAHRDRLQREVSDE